MFILNRWLDAFKSKSFVIDIILTVFFSAAVIWLSGHFYNWVEIRPGVVLDDPFLKMFLPKDVTILTFFLIYLAILTTIYQLLMIPNTLLDGVQSYLVLVCIRTLMMWSIPLDAPLTILPLKDPVVEWIVTSPTLTKDLFFSGHTSTLFLMALLASRLKPLYFLATFFVAVCVLLQHVHYLVDVLVAPFVAYAAFKIVHTIKDKIRI